MPKQTQAQDVLERVLDFIQTDGNLKLLEPQPRADEVSPIVKPGDPETLVLLISDLQAGHETESFNFEVLEERMNRLVERTIRIASIHKLAHPIPTLEIFLLGDLVHGERVGKTVSLDELEDVIEVQMFGVVIPLLKNAIMEFSRHFDQVNVRCVQGNHGVVSKENAGSTNWDNFIHKTLEIMFRDIPNVEFTVAHRFYQIVDVRGTKFFLAHGDQIKMWMNIPIYGVVNRGMRWRGMIPEKFDVMTLGHFHNYTAFDWNDLHIIINGTFVTDDAWCMKTIGMAGSCCQVLMSVHERRGITFTSKIQLA